MVHVPEENINSIIATNPLLLNSRDAQVIKVGNHYLPYSTGIEIECTMKNGFNEESFRDIEGLLSCDVNKYSEQRFRIDNGINGLKALRIISDNMIKEGLLNEDSGIHYHIDCTDAYDTFTHENVESNKDWMLEELDTWNYKGSYNKRDVSFTMSANWIRFQPSFKTMEFRLGEMTFSYPLLFKRIVHANSIVKRYKANTFISPLEKYKDDYEEEIKNRIIKIP